MEKECKTVVPAGCGGEGKCPECEKREMERKKAEETQFAVMVSIVPVMTFLMFNLMGLM